MHASPSNVPTHGVTTYVVMQITLYDIKEGDEDSDPVVEKLGAKVRGGVMG